MVQSSVMSATQFIVRIILAIKKLLEKKPPAAKRVPPPPPVPAPSWALDESGFVEYSGVTTSLRPVLPLPLETQKIQQAQEGTRAYLIWRDVISPSYFDDLRAMLGLSKEKQEGES